MKKHILVISALLLAATACQSKERRKANSYQKEEASPADCEEEESCRTISEEFSIEEEQFKAIAKKSPELIIEEFVQQTEEQAPQEPVVEFEEEQEKQQPIVERSIEEEGHAPTPETVETDEKTLLFPVILAETLPIPETPTL